MMALGLSSTILRADTQGGSSLISLLTDGRGLLGGGGEVPDNIHI